MQPSVAAKVVAHLHRGDDRSSLLAPASATSAEDGAGLPSDELTEREYEVLRYIARGSNNREIGEALFITEGTVKNHVSSILSKLSLRDRTQAALWARERGLA